MRGWFRGRLITIAIAIAIAIATWTLISNHALALRDGVLSSLAYPILSYPTLLALFFFSPLPPPPPAAQLHRTRHRRLRRRSRVRRAQLGAVVPANGHRQVLRAQSIGGAAMSE